MNEYSIRLDATAAALYGRIAREAGLPVEQVLSDALFRLAGELSLNSLRNRKAT